MKTKKWISFIIILTLCILACGVGVTAKSTPRVYMPESGKTVFSGGPAKIDVSNTSEGYFIANYSGKNKKVKLQVECPNGVTYSYNLHGGDEVFPLSAGDGTYKIGIYENVTGNRYSKALQESVKVYIRNTYGPYLYPNQYVNFNAKSEVVKTANAFGKKATTDIDLVTTVYNYVTSHIKYDYDKAANIGTNYTSNPDAILKSGAGICLDYAAVMASMLRSQGIPTRLEVGYAGKAYHAWVSTFIKDSGWVNGIIRFDGKNWSLMDPTFGANSSAAKLKTFIGDGTNYSTKFVY
ncbi:MAG: transglutaminase-like domain-containing protein [Lachnospiraceae bacterium]|nr:transglutaminase-like domain-containing protein [Lachnospiraceae bacterium]